MKKIAEISEKVREKSAKSRVNSAKIKRFSLAEIIYFAAFLLLIPLWRFFPFDTNVKLISYTILCFAGIYIFRETFLKAARDFAQKPAKILLIILAGFVANTILLAIFSGISGAQNSQNDADISVVLTQFSPFLVLPILGIFGVICEELIFRHLLIGRISEQFRGKFAIFVCAIFSALIFGFYHLHNFDFADLTNIVNYVIYGFTFAAVYIATGKNILATIIWHVFNNLFGLIGMIH